MGRDDRERRGDDGGGRGADGGHAALVRLLWGPPPRPARGPRPSLDPARIAEAGVELADAGGLADVSMQRVAERLGVTKMALYRYVPGRAELVALMVEAAVGPCPPAPERPGAWREQLADWAREAFAVFSRHPWALEATLGPRVTGPHELSWLERVVAALEGTGLSGAERLDAAVLLVGHVRSIAQQLRAAGPGAGPEARTAAALGGLVRAHGERFPALASALAVPPAPGEQDQAWEFGLQRILDGLAALVERRTR